MRTFTFHKAYKNTVSKSIVGKALMSLCFFLCMMGQVRGQEFAYVPNGGNKVFVVNTSTNALHTTITGFIKSWCVAVSPDWSRAYVTDTDNYFVRVISTSTNTITTSINTFPHAGPSTLVVSPDGSKLYVLTANDKILVINTSSNTITSTITVPNQSDIAGICISPDGNKLYAANGLNSSISVISTISNAITNTINVGFQPSGLAVNPSGTKLFVANSAVGTLSIIDTATEAVIATPTIGGGSAPMGVCASPDGSKVYVANINAGTFSVVNVATNALVFGNFVPTANAVSMLPNGSKLFIACGGSGNVIYTINPTNNSIIGNTTLGALSGFIGNMVPLVYALPTLTPSVTTLSGFSATTVSNSVSQNFTVSGTNLVANATVSLSTTDYEISTDNTNFSATLNLPQSAGNLTGQPVTVHVRLKTGLSAGAKSATLTIASSGATNQAVSLSGTVSTPTLTPSVTTLSGFSATTVSNSVSQNFTVSGTNLVANATVSLSTTDYEISTDNTTFLPTLNLAQSAGNLTGQPVTIHVRLKTGLSAGAKSATLTIASTGATNQTVSLSGTVFTPTLTPSVTTLSGFSATTVSNSVAQNFTVSGTNLVANATVSLSTTDYEISTDNTTFLPALNLPQSAGNLTGQPVTIFVRLKIGLSAGAKSATLTIASSGATSQNISLSGTVSTPTLTPSVTTLSGFSATTVSNSVSQNFTVSGTNLVANATVSLSTTDYELSTDNTTFSATLNLPQSTGNLTGQPVTIHVRLKTGLSAGAKSATLTIASTGATNQAVSLSGTVFTPTLTPSVTTLSGFNATTVSNSASQNFTVSGTNLVANATVSLSTTDYELSTDNTTFLPTLNLAQSAGNLTGQPVTVHVRLKTGLSAGAKSATLTIASAGATNQTVSLSGIVNFPPPTITSFLPTSGIVGATIIITGTNFNTTPANNIVYFGAVKATVSASTTTSITVTVPVGATSVTPITVLNTESSLQASSLQSTTPHFVVTLSIPVSLNYTTTTTTIGGNFLTDIASGDFNADGKIDIVTISNLGANVRFGNGDGSFTNSATYLVSTSSVSHIAIQDLDANGSLDIAVASNNSANILLNNGNGTFGNATSFPVGTSPYSITIGDFNNDGKQDIATANNTSNNVSLILGNGLGSFGAPTNFTVATNPASIISADFNEDGKLDLAVVNSNTSNPKLNILLGNGNGGFTVSTIDIFSSFVGVISKVVCGDFNNDQNIDLVITRSNDGVQFLAGDGTGNFLNNPVTYSFTGASNATDPTAYPTYLKFGNLNGDDNLDIISSNISNNLSVLLGAGSGAFGSVVYSTTDNSTSLIVGDFNNDNRQDIINAHNDGKITTLLYTTPTVSAITLPKITSFVPISGSVGASVTINGSNFNTMLNNNAVYFGNVRATLSSATNSQLIVQVPYGADPNSTIVVQDLTTGFQGSSLLSSAPFFKVIHSPTITPNYVLRTLTLGASNPFPQSVISADLNNDGKMDLISGNGSNDNVSVLMGNGNGTFALPILYAMQGFKRPLRVADLNNDGKLDICAASTLSNKIPVLYGNGNGTFGTQNTFYAKESSTLELGDFNNDGRVDIVTKSGGQVSSSTGVTGVNPFGMDILLNNSTNGFTNPVFIPVGNLSYTILMPGSISASGGGVMTLHGDFNTDGNLDIVYLSSPNKIYLFTGKGNGEFNLPTIITTNLTSTTHGCLGDFNNDGKMDIVCVGSGMQLLLGNGDGTFGTPVSFGVGSSYVFTGNFNGDNNLDLATFSGTNVVLLLGNGNGTFTIQTINNVTSGDARQIAVTDLNNDGRTDMAIANGPGHNLIILLSLAPPTALPATNTTKNSFQANWTSSIGATQYRLDVSTDDFATYISGYQNLLVTDTVKVVSGLLPNTNYKYRIRAENANSLSINSNIISVFTIIDAPIATTATQVTNNSFTANWLPVAEATAYRLDVSKDNFTTFVDGFQNLEVLTTSKSVTGLENNTVYQYRVRAINGNIASPNSNTKITSTILPAGSGNVLDFSLAYLNVGKQDALTFGVSNFTVETWIKTNDATATKDIFSIGTSEAGKGLRFVVAGNKLRADIAGSTGTLSTRIVADNFWHHVALVRNGNNWQYFIDGLADATFALPADLKNDACFIGQSNIAPSNTPFLGNIDELRVWGQARSLDSLRANMCRKITGTQANLLAYYRFDEKIGNTTENKSVGKSFDATIVSTPTWATSGAPIGDLSVHSYMLAALSLTDTDVFTISNFRGNPTGVHIYKVKQTPNNTTPPTNYLNLYDSRYWGVFVVEGTNPRYDMKYDYSTNSTVGNANALRFARRLNNAAPTWNKYGGIVNRNVRIIAKTKNIAQEYILANRNNIHPNFKNGGTTLKFVSASSHSATVANPLQDDFTLDFWMRTSQTSLTGTTWKQGNRLVDGGLAGVQNDFGVSILNGKIAFGVRDVTIQSNTTVNDGEWHYVVATRSKATGELKLYIDGALEKTGTGSTNVLNASLNLYLGSRAETDFFFNGEIDELRCWENVLAQNTIYDWMNLRANDQHPNYEGLVGYYRFDENTGTLIEDLTNGNDGALSAATLWNTATQPLGDGNVDRIVVNAGNGTTPTVFPAAGVKMTFPAGGTYPNGELVVTRIDATPDAMPKPTGNFLNCYFVVRNYGANKTFSPISEITIDLPAGNTIAPTDIATPSNLRLYKREDNAVGTATWQIKGGAFAASNGPGSITYKGGGGGGGGVVITDWSQITIISDTTPLSLDDLENGMMHIYPNPVSNQLWIVSERVAQSKKMQARLYDALGKNVLATEGNLSEIETSLNKSLPTLHKGLYLLQIQLDNKTWTIKLIKE